MDDFEGIKSGDAVCLIKFATKERRGLPFFLLSRTLLPDAGCSRQHQAVAFGAGKLAVGADGGAGDAELTSKGCSQLRVKHLLDLLVVAVHGEAEESEKTEIGIGDMHREIAPARTRSNGGISRADIHTRPVDVRQDMDGAALYRDADILGGEAAANGHRADAATQRRERGGWNLDKGVDT